MRNMDQGKRSITHSLFNAIYVVIAHFEIFIFLIATLGLCLLLWLSPQIVYARSISKAELQRMSAEEYIGMMRQTSILAIPEDVTSWPEPKDIPYLLMLTQSSDYAGSTVGQNEGLSVLIKDYKSTVGVNAVFLLKAIKDRNLRPYSGIEYPLDKDQINDWAHDVIKTGDYNFGPLASMPELYDDELVTLTAFQVLEKLKNTDLLILCTKQGSSFKVVGDWPKRDDIPYLLSVVGSTEKSGVFFNCSFSVIPYDTESTVGEAALILLYAVKSGGFDMAALRKPDNPEALLAWARAEAEKMKSENSEGAFVTP